MRIIFAFFITFFLSSITAQEAKWVNNPPKDSSDIIMDMVLKSPVPVVMDFWAPWCGPCRMLGPVLEDIKKEYGSKIKIIKVNIDVNVKMANYFQVQSIPAVFFVKNRTVTDYLLGYRQKPEYVAAIEKLLAPSITNADSASKPESSSKTVKK